MRLLVGLIILICITNAVGPVFAEERYIHVVQHGENLFRISLRYDVEIKVIMEANGLTDPTRILVGQELIIPGYSPDPNPADTLLPTPEITPMPESSLTATQEPAAAPTPELTATKLPQVVGPQTTEPAPSASHIVQRGETLTRIAAQYNVTIWAVAQANELASIHTLSVGQLLTIPGMILDSSAAEGQKLVEEVIPAKEEVYVVQMGDTLTRIAYRYGTTIAELVDLNKIINPSVISPGLTIRLTRTAPIMAGHGKRILVDISEQHLYAFEDEQLVYSYVASTGMAPTFTKAGQFQVQSKIDNAYGATWDIWMPHWLGIYYAGSTENGIHALPIMSNGQTLWAGYLGTPISYGCVVLGTEEAETLYNWAPIGTPVTIQY